MPCFIDVFRRLVMSSKHNFASRLLAVFALATLSLATVAQAQPYGPGRGGPGYMMGPGMMDRQLFGRMCSPRMAGFAEWRLDRMEQVIKPSEAQRAKFDEFKAASKKAAETMRTACATDVPTIMRYSDSMPHGSSTNQAAASPVHRERGT